MGETLSLKVLARQILAREREQERLSQRRPNGCPSASEHSGQDRQQATVMAEATAVACVAQRAAGEPDVEQPCAARRGRVVPLDNGAFLHFCCECGRFGAFGYRVRLREGRLGRWYCGEHRPNAARTENYANRC